MQRYLAEAVGTCVLVFGGCGSTVLAGEKLGFLGVSCAFFRCWPWPRPSARLRVAIFIRRSRWACSLGRTWPHGMRGAIMAQVVGAAGVLVLIAQGLHTGDDPAVGGLAANS